MVAVPDAVLAVHDPRPHGAVEPQRGEHPRADCRHRQLAQLETEGSGDVCLFSRRLAVEEQPGLVVVFGEQLRFRTHLGLVVLGILA